MKKRCRECGGKYETRNKEITLRINHKDIEALEDALYVQLTDDQWKKIKKNVHKIWVQVCRGEEKWASKKERKEIERTRRILNSCK